MPPQRSSGWGGPKTRSQTANSQPLPPKRKGRKKWQDFRPTEEDVQRQQATLDLEVGMDMKFPRTPTTWERRTPTAQRASVCKGAARHAVAGARKAQSRAGTVNMKVFSLAKAVATPHGRPENVVEVEPPGLITVLHGDKPARLLSKDGYDIFCHLPGGIHGKSLTELVEAARTWGYTCKPSKSVSNDKKGGYKEVGDLVGTTRIVLAWHAIGHPHDEPGVCADVLRTRLTFNGACELLEKLDVINSYVMALLKAIDPKQYESLEKLNPRTMGKTTSRRARTQLIPTDKARQALLRKERNRRYYVRRKLRESGTVPMDAVEPTTLSGLEASKDTVQTDGTWGAPAIKQPEEQRGAAPRFQARSLGTPGIPDCSSGPVPVPATLSLGDAAQVRTLNEALLEWGYMRDSVKYQRGLDKNMRRAQRADDETRTTWMAEMDEWLAEGDELADELYKLASEEFSASILSVIFNVLYMIAAVEARLYQL
ncbi:hypothetical protein C8T65DRAFT_748776 [Cerioporus squamosus]|nr:hypothetical protein C8T65DRAFT_748776 [Cerioporus squamosus]